MIAAFSVGLGASLTVLWLDARVQAYLAGPPLGAARIYAAPTVLRPGMREPGGSLRRRLVALGYEAAPAGPLEPGTFRATAATIEISQRPSPVPWAARPRETRITLRAGRITELREAGGGRLDGLELAPEVLAVLGAAGPTLESGAAVVPDVCRAAVLAAEDRHFFHHPGVDPMAIVRALWANVRAGETEQGGSTITQQLVKNAFLTPRRTLGRKAAEAVLAILLEARATKEEILERYLTSVYLGADGGLPVYGFAQAAGVYFGKPLGDLGPAECALLAGIVRSPNGLAPRRHPEAALARRNHLLAEMVDEGLLDASAGERATAAPLGLAAPRPRAVGALYVAAEVGRELDRLLPPDIARAPGLRIFTGVDAHLQRAAEEAVRRRIEALEQWRRRRERLQAALVALDPWSGHVRALVGGRDFGSSPLDRAVRTRRQPGSAFKPFVYLAALDPARRGDTRPWTVVSVIEDRPVAVRVGARTWRPANHDGTFAGTVTLADALAQSRNAATVRLALDVGIDAVLGAARDLGLSSPLPRVPALALGAGEASLLELTAAYGVFASGGIRRPPRLVVAVTSAAGDTLWAAAPVEERVLEPGVAYLVTHLLERVVDAGTGRGVRAAGLTGAAAGKTGTTDDARDAWFIGFTPTLAAGAWVGLDQGAPMGLTGAQAALPIWTDFMKAAADGDAAQSFAVPDDIVWQEVDPTTGGLATAACPETLRTPFLPGTEPGERCAVHRSLWTSVGAGVAGAGRGVESGGRRFGRWFRDLFR
jgi:penicillin-binding protein 1B